MTVALILKDKGADIVSIAPEAPLADAVALLAEHRIGALLVLDTGGRIAGMLSERDLVRGLAKKGGALLDDPVSTLMTENVITTGPGDSVARVMTVMTKNRFRHLPVMSGKRLIGMISIGDVVKHRLEEAEHEAEALKAYIAG